MPETAEAQKLDLSKVIRICLNHTRFKDLERLRTNHLERVLSYVRSAYPKDRVTEDDLRGFGQQSDRYDQLAFMLVIRQEAACEACRKRPGKKPFCEFKGRRYEVFRRSDDGTFYVWFYPGSCDLYDKPKGTPVEVQKPEKIGRF